MDQQRIKHLIDLLAESDLSSLTLSEGGTTVTLSRHADAPGATLSAKPAVAQAVIEPAAAAANAPAGVSHSESARQQPMCSPLYGVLHLTPSPDEPPFVAVGDAVTAGQTLCIVEAMKMFHQVTATRDGQVKAILAAGGAEVESGQPLFDLI